MTRLMLACWLVSGLALAGCLQVNDKGATETATMAKSPADSIDISTLELLVRLAAKGHRFQHVRVLTATWTAPETGNPAVRYLFELDAIGPQWTQQMLYTHVWDLHQEIMLPWDVGVVYGRAAGVDSLGRVGPWSEWGEWTSSRE